jgi:ParB family chromosome partitioning protein
MGKAEELLKSMGGAILESASHRGAPAAMPTLGQAIAGGGERMAGVSRSKVALEIPVEKIEPDEDQPREEFEPEALERLSESIKSKGLLQPISVRWVESRSKYVIIAGERRWRASRIAGMTSLSCVVVDKPLSPGELLALQCIENLVREDLKPIEEAKAFRTLLTVNNWSGNQLSKELGISQSSIAQALALLDLPEPIQASVEAGDLAASTAYAITKLDDPEFQNEVAARVVAEKLSRAETNRVVREAAERKSSARSEAAKGRGVSKARPKPATTRTFKTTSGIRITAERAKGIEPAALVAALEEAAEKARAELSQDQDQDQDQVAA